MGSSTKRKGEKHKDFQKPKLRVGKARPKPSNFTDTSFKSKAIVIKDQSLSTTAPSQSNQFSRHLSLLSSRTDSQRKDSLSYLTTSIASRPVGTPLQLPVSILLPRLLPLALDGSNGVRTQLLVLLQGFPSEEVEDFADQILLYVRAGMTHLGADIRSTSMDILDWAVNATGPALVACPGGWSKTLKCFLALLGWPDTDASTSWSTAKVSLGRAGSEGKAFIKSLNVLTLFMRAGLIESEAYGQVQSYGFPMTQTRLHLISRVSGSQARLNLFGVSGDEDTEMCEEREDRQRVFGTRFQRAIMYGLEVARKEGGEIGRAAATATKVVVEGMSGYELDTS